ncbi:MAG: hypothetical protein ACTS3R_15450 [Inquilinaceae bacterium]
MAVPAAVGAALGAWAYFGKNTGVDGTIGALLAFLGAVAVTLGALAAVARLPGWASVTLNVLLALGTLLTAFAAWMLMQTLFAIAMLLAGVALCVALLAPGRFDGKADRRGAA